MGFATRTPQNKGVLQAEKNQCASDLKLVLGVTDGRIKELLKRPRKLHEILQTDVTALAHVDTDEQFAWVKEKNLLGNITQLSLN